MFGLNNILQEKLQHKLQELSFRSLSLAVGIDFSSNDYLGLARSSKLQDRINHQLLGFPQYLNGSTGSRLLTGNSAYAEHLEQYLADFHEAEAALLFNSGYDANMGLFECLTDRHDIILYDEKVHASMIDGIRLSHAKSYKFEHNNLSDLEQKLHRHRDSRIFVALESVYSMDGDMAPLTEIVALCKQYKAQLIVDEAHATGVFGKQGRGYVNELGLQNEGIIRLHTFGKAVGVHGAVIVGSAILRQYLINYCRTFIYTTALPFHSLVSIHCAYEQMKEAETERKQLRSLIDYFQQQSQQLKHFDFLRSQSPIQGIIIPGNEQVRAVATKLKEAGLDIRPIVSPTVAVGHERLRICLHAYNTTEEIDRIFSVLQQN